MFDVSAILGFMYISFRVNTSEKDYIINIGFSLHKSVGVQIRAVDGSNFEKYPFDSDDETEEIRGVNKYGTVTDGFSLAHSNGFSSSESDSSSGDDDSSDRADKSLTRECTFSKKFEALKVDCTITDKYKGIYHFKFSTNM